MRSRAKDINRGVTRFKVRLASVCVGTVMVAAGLGACSRDSTAPAKDDPTSGGGPEGGAASSSGGSSETGVESPRPVEITTESMQFEGVARTYVFAKPKAFDAAKSYPLVFSFHGNPGSAEGQAGSLPFDSVSQGEALIVYPGAIDGNWDLYTPTDMNADMNFIKALIDEVATKVPAIDKKRVYAYGYSGGGFFITQFACRFAGVFKAIALNSGGGPDEEQMGFPKRANGCFICPGGPIATLVIHGEADNEVDVASGLFTATCFASTNSCGDTLTPSEPTPCETTDGCPAATPVKRCILPGIGHGWWDQGLKVSWSFFKSLP